MIVIVTGRDDGAASETRVLPCIKRTWCILHRDHEGSCHEEPRKDLPRSDYGPKRKEQS